jgi:hypothetical protein
MSQRIANLMQMILNLTFLRSDVYLNFKRYIKNNMYELFFFKNIDGSKTGYWPNYKLQIVIFVDVGSVLKTGRVGTCLYGSAGFGGTGQWVFTGRVRTDPFWRVCPRPVLDPSGWTGRIRSKIFFFKTQK